jgi:xylitol oxidase
MNWAGNVTFQARSIQRPTSVAQLCELVRDSERVRALGTRHSFNEIADTAGDLVSLAALPELVELDGANATARVSAGLRYGDIAPVIDRYGFALPNLGSLPHISVAGACATGTHGSGDANGILATAVSALTMVNADGELVTLTRGDPDFAGAVVGLGCVGIVVELSLDLVPAFDMRQDVYTDLPLDEVCAHFDEITTCAYSVSLLTDWAGERVNMLWLKSRVDMADTGPVTPLFGATFFGGHAAGTAMHPVPGVNPEFTTPQLGVTGPWFERLPHFQLRFTPSNGEELQTEYFVARDVAVAAIQAVSALHELLAPVLQISEIRTIAADELWLSPAYGRDRVALHFTWIKDVDAVRPVLSRVEQALAPFAAVPHWGKFFTIDAHTVTGLHPRMDDFVALTRRYDPTGKFANDFTRRLVRSG